MSEKIYNYQKERRLCFSEINAFFSKRNCNIVDMAFGIFNVKNECYIITGYMKHEYLPSNLTLSNMAHKKAKVMLVVFV